MWESREILNVFSTWTLKQIFWNAKTVLKKLQYRFLVESSKIENASFPYKTAILEASAKTDRIASTKWTYHKERSFASNYVNFLKFCFILRTSYKELIWCTNNPNADICPFCERWSFIWRWFSLWVSLRRKTTLKKQLQNNTFVIITCSVNIEKGPIAHKHTHKILSTN